MPDIRVVSKGRIQVIRILMGSEDVVFLAFLEANSRRSVGC